MSTPSTFQNDQKTLARRAAPVAFGLVFLVAYLLVSPVAGGLADRGLPLPDDPVGDVVGYYVANPVAAVATAALQAISVCGLLAFARALRLGGRTVAIAGVAFGAMLVSSAVAVLLALVAGDVAGSTVGMLREVNFYAGGVVHVVALGTFVLAATQELHGAGVVRRAMRIFGWVAGVIAVVSILSLFLYYANVFLPLGRVLCMVWSVTIGIVWWRRRA